MMLSFPGLFLPPGASQKTPYRTRRSDFKHEQVCVQGIMDIGVQTIDCIYYRYDRFVQTNEKKSPPAVTSLGTGRTYSRDAESLSPC